MKRKSPVEKHFDKIAVNYDLYKNRHRYYYDNLKNLLSSFIPTGSRVFEVGCGTGDLIACLKPTIGVGFDISSKMIGVAKRKYNDIHFSTRWPTQKFEYVFMSDVVEHLKNPEVTFCKISKLMNKNSVFICTMANPIFEPLLMLAEKLKLKMPEGPHKRTKYEDLEKILENAGLRTRVHNYKLLMPIKIPGITGFINKYLERPFRKFAFIEYFIATRL